MDGPLEAAQAAFPVGATLVVARVNGAEVSRPPNTGEDKPRPYEDAPVAMDGPLEAAQAAFPLGATLVVARVNGAEASRPPTRARTSLAPTRTRP